LGLRVRGALGSGALDSHDYNDWKAYFWVAWLFIAFSRRQKPTRDTISIAYSNHISHSCNHALNTTLAA
jgi:hypothetical protein